MKVSKKGFTLIELLVVIAIIALLLSVILPALRRAKVLAMRVVCAYHIKQDNLALLNYGMEYDENLPLQSLGGWLHDVAYATTDMIIDLGGADKHTFYCPSTKRWDDRGNNPLYWQWSQSYPIAPDIYYGPEPTEDRENEYRVTGYFWMMEFVNEDNNWWGRGWEPVGEHTWLYKTTHYSNGEGLLGPPIQNAGSVPLSTDQIFTDDAFRDYEKCDFFGSMLGGLGFDYNIPDVTNHAEGSKVEGGNIGYLDGHVKWRKIKKMMRRNDWAPFHWW
jgi:prepilin-type N-terminal cleavage/methylation domain-containing protein/prepilin-type processing-associated H-X9-DG protein